ncbi:MAG TPA: aldo/keto reductase [Actinomycetota bacterium]|nr:aldo/keto reductase [Actinomycetota bacterium]
MEMRKLGREGPEISVVGYGAWEAGGTDWGPNPSDDEVIAAIRAALDAGMTWIDTAEVYGDGRSEELVGRAVAGRRDEVLIFTKVAPEPEGSGLRPEQVRRAIRGSLRRLGVDHVDLYQVHWPDRGVPVEETWGAMAELVEEGLARHVGVSNFDQGLVERCLRIRHVDAVQNEFSLIERGDRAALLPWLAERGVGYLAYGPLGYGILTGSLGPAATFPEGDWRARREGPFAPGVFERNLELVARLRPIAERLHLPLAVLALRWVVEQPGVTAAIAGSRNPEHVRTNARAGEVRLDPEALRAIQAAVEG